MPRNSKPYASANDRASAESGRGFRNLALALAAYGIAPRERLTWLMEVAPILIALP